MGPMVDDFPIIQPESQAAIYRIEQRAAGNPEETKGSEPAKNAASKPSGKTSSGVSWSVQ
jgi:hypothetical protein